MPNTPQKSVTRKLTRMNILVSAAALVMACAAFITYDAFTFHDRLVFNVAIQAEIVASSSVSALLFDDPQSATATLAALRAAPNLVYAAIRTPDGRIFAEYWPGPPQQAPAWPQIPHGREQAHQFEGGTLVMARSIVFDGKPLGAVLIQSNMHRLWARIRQYALLAAGVLLLSLAGAFLVSAAFRRGISEPIAQLSTTAQTVSQSKDYSLRATSPNTGDEMDLLVGSFNEMLTQIQERDAALQRGRDELEQRVDQRTAQLSASNQELEQLTRALQQSQELYRRLFDSNPHPVWVYDLQTLGFLDVNLAAIQHYGYSREEFLALTLRDIRPAEDVPSLMLQIGKTKTEPEVSSVWRHRKKDGVIIDVEVTSHAMLYAGRSARIVVASDITQRKKMEHQLKASEEKFRSVVEAASDAVISADAAGNIIQFNSAAQRIFGYSEQEIFGQPLTVLMPRHLREAHLRGWQRYHTTGQARVLGKTVELAGIRKNGEEFPLELSLETWRSGEKTFFTGLLRDVTERKRAELLLRQQQTELEATNRELEAFCYSVSHDLRAPLRGIDGFSQALLEDYSDRLDEQGKSYLNRVRAATQRMAALIDDLLDLSRVTRTEMQREPVDLSKSAALIAAELQRSHPNRAVDLNIAAGLTSMGDARLLRQVLENLLSNAWKFTAQRPRARITFGAKQHNGAQAFFVSDDGAGFDPAYAGRLFGVFQRLHSVSDFPGTGVGLAIVQRIVHRHGGEVWAESALGKGATFYFTLGEH